MVWSHTVCSGSCWDCSSLNTLACLWNSIGTFVRSVLAMLGLPKVTLPRKYLSCICLGLGTFLVLGTNVAHLAFEVCTTIRS
jgi:hypothetical protein